MAFKIGDYVLVKPGTLLEDGGKVDNWGGKIIDVTPSHNTCQIQFDSITLASITDQYIIDCYEEGSEPFEYNFLSNELILSRRRDNAPLLESAVKLMYLRMEELDPDPKKKYEENLEKIWTENFYKDSLFNQLTEQEQDNADFAISCFMGYMWDYYGENPSNWTEGAVEDVCLDVIPRKVSTEMDFFESLGEILITFFQFLDKEKNIANASTLIKTVKAIQKEIPKKAADSSNWGMAKSMMMGATE